MEYKKHDMYKQAGLTEKKPLRPMGPPPAKDKKEGKVVKELDLKKEVTFVEMEVPEVIVRKRQVVGITPELPVLGQNNCGYCVTPGMAYVPMTQWNETYEPEVGFHRGTIFPELDYPFVGKGACDHE